MAGKVLRNSRGQFQGSTRGWMAGVRRGGGSAGGRSGVTVKSTVNGEKRKPSITQRIKQRTVYRLSPTTQRVVANLGKSAAQAAGYTAASAALYGVTAVAAGTLTRTAPRSRMEEAINMAYNMKRDKMSGPGRGLSQLRRGKRRRNGVYKIRFGI